MRILFITSDYQTPDAGSNIYTDLAEALNNANHSVKVVVAEERKKINETKLNEENGISVLRVKTGNLYEVGFVEKTITFLKISRDLIKGIKKYYNNEQYDLILFQSPPVTFHTVVKWAMKKYKAKSYLMMKDIFPQNGVDIGLYKKNSLVYYFFRYHERKLYKVSSKIGCMSQKNIDYLIEHNPYLDKSKFELFPNTVKVSSRYKISEEEKNKIRKKYGLKDNDIVAIFGGNFGKPQGLDFLVDVIDLYKNNENLKFVLIGRGTEKKRIFKIVKERNYQNVLMYDYIPRNDYEILSSACDIGLIFLDRRFTVPNFPSKTLSYFECQLPIMAAIDVNTDYGEMLEKTKCGYWVENGNLKAYKNKFDKLLNNEKLRHEFGRNGRRYFEKECNVLKSVKILEKEML